MIEVSIDIGQLKSFRNRNCLDRFLQDHGLDQRQSFEMFEDLSRYKMVFKGTPLPNRIVNTIKTVIGLVPVTIPWE
jgi:hypothetical protein